MRQTFNDIGVNVQHRVGRGSGPTMDWFRSNRVRSGRVWSGGSHFVNSVVGLVVADMQMTHRCDSGTKKNKYIHSLHSAHVLCYWHFFRKSVSNSFLQNARHRMVSVLTWVVLDRIVLCGSMVQSVVLAGEVLPCNCRNVQIPTRLSVMK